MEVYNLPDRIYNSYSMPLKCLKCEIYACRILMQDFLRKCSGELSCTSPLSLILYFLMKSTKRLIESKKIQLQSIALIQILIKSITSLKALPPPASFPLTNTIFCRNIQTTQTATKLYNKSASTLRSEKIVEESQIRQSNVIAPCLLT